ncbi:LOW QUALITY PROTEIN: uncharacterized protein EMH_0015810 [Eimeria mitis]|uniref:Transmembrane protein n=1 Tax=Eimeria mitis TaxID=44415 RepID=U6K5W0_9EIME|nr:LOW QUALITY PROTEIN: uncharacterized protein EMH_0015810 [Eimeria mitis]CDJ33370.1 hypothetical protein, conserved [Eimeria mitis]
MALETMPAGPIVTVAKRDVSAGRPGSPTGNNLAISDKELRTEGNSSEELPQASDAREERRARATRYKRSISSSWGLGEGVTGRMTAVAILGLLLLSISIPIAVFKLHRMQGGRHQHPFDLLPMHEPDAAEHPPRHDQDPAAAGGPDAPAQDSQEAVQLPITRDLHESFLALKHTGDHGLLLSVRGPDWDSSREEFLAALDRVADMSPSLFENTYNKSEETLRLMMAMDLACLENTAVETKLAIEDARPGHSGGYTEEMAVRFQQHMQARRKQVKAVDMWETAVVNDELGADPALKDSLMKLLLAVRSRAASSEYLTAASAEALFSSEPIVRRQAEENRIHEGVAYLIKAGQLAASDILIKTYVAPAQMYVNSFCG